MLGLWPVLGQAGGHVTAQGPPPARWLPASARQARACPRPYKAWGLRAEPAASCTTRCSAGVSHRPGGQCQGEAGPPGGFRGLPGLMGLEQET